MAIKLKQDIDVDYVEEPTSSNSAIGVDQRKKLKDFSAVSILYWFGLFATILMVLLSLTPIASAMLFFMVGIAWFLIVVGGSIFTLGLIWMSEEYKNLVHFVSGIMSSITNPDNIEKATEIITKIYWYALPIGASIIFIGLAISIFRFNQDSIFKKIRKRKMISFIVFASLFTIAAIVAGIFIVSGAQ